MTERFNIIVARDNGDIHAFVVSRKKLLLTVLLGTISVTVLTFSSLFTVGFSLHNSYLVHKMTALKKDLQKTNKMNAELETHLAKRTEVTPTEVDQIKVKHEQPVTALQFESSHLNADLKTQNIQQEAAIKKEKEHLLTAAISELRERSELLANVMNHIGVKIKKRRHSDAEKHRGGPFIAIEDTRFNRLLHDADQYLELIRTVPLGPPAPGSISSPYGARMDPIVHTAAFHPGIDIEGDIGDKVRATAAGKVVFAGKNGGYGNYILIDHGNSYSSGYGHLLNIIVKEGDKVTRGQVIGSIGNTGRSTGSHLHYEISVDGKTINPYKFLKIADISKAFVSRPEK